MIELKIDLMQSLLIYLKYFNFIRTMMIKLKLFNLEIRMIDVMFRCGGFVLSMWWNREGTINKYKVGLVTSDFHKLKALNTTRLSY